MRHRNPCYGYVLGMTTMSFLKVGKWSSDAACRGEPIEVFYEKEYLDVAKAICRKCPVRQECQKQGRKEKFGVWGGYPRGWLEE
ncbi:MAG: hypothetical protein CL557_13015 [Alphaproteobacteria bacterium]|nr:hypothetical protein [Alphaproteobacteria bacterium]